VDTGKTWISPDSLYARYEAASIKDARRETAALEATGLLQGDPRTHLWVRSEDLPNEINRIRSSIRRQARVKAGGQQVHPCVEL